MKIMLVTMDYPPPMGGIQVVAKNLEDDLTAIGHEVCVVNFDGRNTSNYKKLAPSDLFSSPATRNEYFSPGRLLNPGNLFQPTGYRDFVYNNLIYRVTNEARKWFQPDLTHVLKPTLYTAIYECPEPFIVSCHGSDIHDSFPVRYSLLHAALIHCVSNYLREQALELLSDDRSPPHIAVIYNSIDSGLFSPLRDTSEKLILTCCRLVSSKNVDTVIRACSLLAATVMKDYQHIIIGDGPEMGYLTTLARKLKLENVKFTGEISDQAILRQWLHRAELFVLCPHAEGFGISFIEAQAAGLPVIGSNRGGVPEAVGDGGLLVEDPADPREIAAKIELLLTDRDLHQKLRQNALARIKQFDRQSKIREFEHLYYAALDGRRGNA